MTELMELTGWRRDYEEQDRIARRLAFLEAQIEGGNLEYEQAQAHMRTASHSRSGRRNLDLKPLMSAV